MSDDFRMSHGQQPPVSRLRLGLTDADAAPSPPSTVFVSPRVIDKVAFEDYATRLRAILEEIRAETARLEATMSRCEETASKLLKIERRLNERAASPPIPVTRRSIPMPTTPD